MMSLHSHNADAENTIRGHWSSDLTPEVQAGAAEVGADQQYDNTFQDAFKTPDSRYHLAPHLCGVLAASRMNGSMCGREGVRRCQTSRIPKRSGSFANTVRLRSTVKNWVCSQEDQTRNYETWIHSGHISTLVVERQRAQARSGGVR